MKTRSPVHKYARRRRRRPVFARAYTGYRHISSKWKLRFPKKSRPLSAAHGTGPAGTSHETRAAEVPGPGDFVQAARQQTESAKRTPLIRTVPPTGRAGSHHLNGVGHVAERESRRGRIY